MTETRIRRLSLPLPGARVLHVALTVDASGTPEDVVIAAGFSAGTALRDLADGVCIPAAALPALCDALAELAPR